MNIIRLSAGQKRRLKVDHPLLDGAKKVSDDDVLDAMTRFVEGDDSARDELIMGQMIVVKNIVGRYLANWTETLRFEEDMVSEAMVAVIETVDALRSDETEDNFHGRVRMNIRTRIEVMLNDSRSMFAPHRKTNFQRLSDGKELEYNYATQLREDLDAGKMDDGVEWVDMLDELEHLGEQDQEHFRALILRCMEKEHNLEEADLSDDELAALNNLARMVCDL